MTTEMVPVSELLRRIQDVHNVKLYQNNLTATQGGRITSIMQRLAEAGLARLEGKRWLVSPTATDQLLALAKGGRPGPGPGTQATLDAEQVRAFANALAASPTATIHDALAIATNWDRTLIDRVERVVIPVTPRQPHTPHKA